MSAGKQQIHQQIGTVRPEKSGNTAPIQPPRRNHLNQEHIDKGYREPIDNERGINGVIAHLYTKQRIRHASDIVDKQEQEGNAEHHTCAVFAITQIVHARHKQIHQYRTTEKQGQAVYDIIFHHSVRVGGYSSDFEQQK